MKPTRSFRPVLAVVVGLLVAGCGTPSARPAESPTPNDSPGFSGAWIGDVAFRLNPTRATRDFDPVRDEQLRRSWYLELHDWTGETVVTVRTLPRRDRGRTRVQELEALAATEISTDGGELHFVLRDSPDGEVCRFEGRLERGEIAATIRCEHRPAGMGTAWTSLGSARFEPADASGAGTPDRARSSTDARP